MIIDTSGNFLDSINDEEFLIYRVNEDKFAFKGDNIFYEIDANCVMLYDHFQSLLFPNSDQYYKEIGLMPIWTHSGGHDSDSGIEKSYFEKLLAENSSEKYHRHLYLVDCQSLIGAIQDRVIFINGNIINFYQNLANLVTIPVNDEDSVFWTTGQNTSLVFSNLYNLFITFYSIMDLITKVAYEIENIQLDFTKYPRLKSSKIMFGDKNRLKISNSKETLFASDEEISLVVNIRNELIHNGSWEVNPKIFIRTENNKIAEKWIFFPDTENGNIVSFKNRKRFFSKGTKINKLLPDLMLSLLNKLNNTINALKLLAPVN